MSDLRDRSSHHRANLQRMRAGNENRFEKVMLFRRRAGG